MQRRPPQRRRAYQHEQNLQKQATYDRCYVATDIQRWCWTDMVPTGGRSCASAGWQCSGCLHASHDHRLIESHNYPFSHTSIMYAMLTISSSRASLQAASLLASILARESTPRHESKIQISPAHAKRQLGWISEQSDQSQQSPAARTEWGGTFAAADTSIIPWCSAEDLAAATQRCAPGSTAVAVATQLQVCEEAALTCSALCVRRARGRWPPLPPTATWAA